jgi:hypothetical protein
LLFLISLCFSLARDDHTQQWELYQLDMSFRGTIHVEYISLLYFYISLARFQYQARFYNGGHLYFKSTENTICWTAKKWRSHCRDIVFTNLKDLYNQLGFYWHIFVLCWPYPLSCQHCTEVYLSVRLFPVYFLLCW